MIYKYYYILTVILSWQMDAERAKKRFTIHLVPESPSGTPRVNIVTNDLKTVIFWQPS